MASVRNCDEVSAECPVSATLYGYRPNLGANLFFLSVFACCATYQLISISFLRVRTYSYIIPLTIGTLLEVIGYVGRVMMHENPWNLDGLAMQLVCLILGPSFASAAISVTFKHIVEYCGAEHSVIKPSIFPWVFIGTDFLCIFIQAVGAGILASATSGSRDPDMLDIGDAIIVTGIVLQVATMFGCAALMFIFYRRYKAATGNTGDHKFGPHDMSMDQLSAQPKYLNDRRDAKIRKRFHIFCKAIVAAYCFILIRCIYRIPEMAAGWGSVIMQEEVSFIVLDGVMSTLAALTLSMFQPAHWFEPWVVKRVQAPVSQS